MGRKHRHSNAETNKPCGKSWWPFKKPNHPTESLNELNYKFEIKEEVIEQLKGYAQHEGNELCGVLTGSQIDDNIFRISKVSPPCVAQNSRRGCERDAARANVFISRDYEDSEHTRVYVGEWHTHPDPHPSPSQTDIASIIQNYCSATRAVPFLIMIIVGTKSIYSSIYTGEEFVVLSELGEIKENI